MAIGDDRTGILACGRACILESAGTTGWAHWPLFWDALARGVPYEATTAGSRVIGLFQNTPALPSGSKTVPSQILFDMQKAHAAYGMKVAVRSLICALLRSGKLSYGIFTMPQRLEMVSDAVGYALAGVGETAQWSVHDYAQLLRPGQFEFTAWFDPASNFWTPSYLRSLQGGKPYPITTLHHTLSNQLVLSNFILPTLLADSYPCDSIICSSTAARKALETLVANMSCRCGARFGSRPEYNGRFDVIPLGVDVDVFCPRDKIAVRDELGLPRDALLLLCFGRISLTDKADLVPLIDVFKALREKHRAKNVILVLAGGHKGDLLRHLESEICAAGLRDCVMTFSPVRQPELLYSASDIFLAPADNIQESFGLTNIEAMAAGIPQVAADWDGYKDTVEQGKTGFLARTYWTQCDEDLCQIAPLFQGDADFDHGALAQSVVVEMRDYFSYLDELISNPELRAAMGAHSRKRAEHIYSWPTVVAQYEALWRDLSESAQALPVRQSGPWHIQPQYYQTFGHYASCQLDEASKITMTELGRQELAREASFPRSEFTQTCRWLRQDVLIWILQAGGVLGDFPLGVLEKMARENFDEEPHAIRRHIMWLLKYGFLAVKTQHSAPLGARSSAVGGDRQ